MRQQICLCLLLATVTACNRDSSSLTPSDNPAVAISQVDGPLVGGRAGALIDAVDAREPRTGTLLVAAAQQYDPVSGQTTENPTSVYVTASDASGVDSVELSLDGTSVGAYLNDGQTFKNPFIFPAPRSGLVSVPIPGNPSGLVASELRARASNTTGQLSETAVLELRADGSRPELGFSASGDGPPYTGPITLSGQAADPETGIRGFSAFLNGTAIEINPATPTSFNTVADGLAAGIQTVRLVATNGVKVPNDAVFTFEVAEETDDGSGDDDGGSDGGETANQDPVVSLLAAPTEGEPPLAVSFTASASDPDGDEVTYLYSFGDGVTTTGAPAASHTYNEPGTYTATVTVDDGNGGTASSSVTIMVGDGDDDGGDDGGEGGGTGNQAPTVALTAEPTTGDAPLDVTLTADASDPDGDTLSYTWDFGNGETASSGSTQNVTYDESGVYTARVTVTDEDGETASDEIAITVGDDGGDDTSAPTISSFTANGETETEVAPNAEVTLAWDITGTATEVTISPDVGDVTADEDKQVTVIPAETTTYTITAENGAGSSTETVEVTVTNDGGEDGTTAPTISSFTADPTSITRGQLATLSWDIEGTVTEVTISPEVGDVTADEDRQVRVKPTTTTTYTINAKNEAATALSKEVTVMVTDNGGVDALDDAAETTPGQPVTIDVLGNDEPGARALIIVAATSPRQGGAVEISRDSKTITYTPAEGFTGEDIFTYTVRDEEGNKASANVTVRVK